MKLTKDQRNAKTAFMNFMLDKDEQFMVIQGSSGSGKSFLLKDLVDSYEKTITAYSSILPEEDRLEYDIALTATTNKAVTVVESFTGKPAYTIHSFLGLKLTNNLSSGKTSLTPTNNYMPVHNTLIIIDEASFISEELFNLLTPVLNNCKVLLVGDQYQLAPVGQQTSIMETLKCTKVYMTEIMRNAGAIMHTGKQFRDTVKHGIFKPIIFNNTDLLSVSGSDFKELIEQEFTSQDYTPNSAKVLAWTNATVQSYNKCIRDMKGLPSKIIKGETVVTNNPIRIQGVTVPVDSLVQVTNTRPDQSLQGVRGNYVEINNMHQAFLPHKYSDTKKLLKKLASKKEWREYFDIKDSWLDLRAIYASSVHKSQGSSYETVFINLTNIGSNWISSDVARLLYVSITRASNKVICFGKLPPQYGG